MRKFKVTISIDEFYEMVVEKESIEYDQREGQYTRNYKETHSFATIEDAVKYLQDNPKERVKEFVKIVNCINKLNK